MKCYGVLMCLPQGQYIFQVILHEKNFVIVFRKTTVICGIQCMRHLT